MTDLSKKALNIEDIRKLAKRRLTRALFDFCDKGSEDQIAMRDNRAALDANQAHARVLNSVQSPRRNGTVRQEDRATPTYRPDRPGRLRLVPG